MDRSQGVASVSCYHPRAGELNEVVGSRAWQRDHKPILWSDVVINSGSPNLITGLSKAPDAGSVNGDTGRHPTRQSAIVEFAMVVAAR